MKKFLLSFSLLLAALTGFSQAVIFEVLSPEPLTGTYDLTYAPAGAAGWNVIPDLTVPENSVEGELVFALDGTDSDSTACEPLVNGADVDGKIAVIWRGLCDFAVKAQNAHQAGAIAVVLVNNVAGAPIVPGGGTSGAGAEVDIPVIMISMETGMLLRDAINDGTATAFIGAVTFPYDLRFLPEMVMRPYAATIPLGIAHNAEEFSVPMGAYLGNSGSEALTGVSLSATITLDGSEIYNESVSDQTIPPGDSIYIALPTFSQESYAIGRYDIVYTPESAEEDEFPDNNQPLETSFSITENLYSYSPWNPETESVDATLFTRPGGEFTPPFEHCLHFRDPNASRLRLEGMHYAISAPAGVSHVNDFVELSAYTWNDEWTLIENLTIADLEDGFDYGLHNFATFTPEEAIYTPYDNQEMLEDNQRYLFCLKTNADSMNFGYGPSTYDYTTIQAEIQEVQFPLIFGESFYRNGFGLDLPPAFAVRLVDVTVGVEDEERVNITPYPNPTMDYIAIPYNGTAASANMTIYDNVGKLVKSSNVNFAGGNMIQVDMSGLPNGYYVFNMQFNDGTTSNFKVVVAR